MSYLWSTILQLPRKITHFTIRNLNLLEYQSKNLLRENGVTVQDFCIIDEKSSSAFDSFTAKEYVIKAQILAGGRGKGHFDNGFKGGVHVTDKRDDVLGIINRMLGHKLITKQTPKGGIKVGKVMVAESVRIARETYVCILLDRLSNGPVIVASPAGGVSIEDVAEKRPHLIRNVPIDIYEGVTDEIAAEVAEFLGFRGALKGQAADQIKKLYSFFLDVDATQVEINPLVETSDNAVMSIDAKINFDDNARFRHEDIFELEDVSERDPREVEAAKYNLNYIGLTGNIACLVNGAGLAMATMDIIKLHGGDPVNFLDVGGGVKEEQVRAAFDILASNKNVRCIWINIFGGIVNCATVANGIVAALKSTKLEVPVIARLEGTNAAEARRIIKESSLNVQTVEHLDDAAKRAVQNVS